MTENIETENDNTKTNPQVGDFVAVTLRTTKGTQKKYVAKILSKETNSYMCTFLRPSQKTRDVFIFSQIEDAGVVLEDEIIEVLKPTETLRRGGVRFRDF